MIYSRKIKGCYLMLRLVKRIGIFICFLLLMTSCVKQPSELTKQLGTNNFPPINNDLLSEGYSLQEQDRHYNIKGVNAWNISNKLGVKL